MSADLSGLSMYISPVFLYLSSYSRSSHLFVNLINSGDASTLELDLYKRGLCYSLEAFEKEALLLGCVF